MWIDPRPLKKLIDQHSGGRHKCVFKYLIGEGKMFCKFLLGIVLVATMATCKDCGCRYGKYHVCQGGSV